MSQVSLKTIEFTFICLIFISCFFLQSFIPLFLIILFFFKCVFESIVSSLIFGLITIIIAIFDIHNAKNFFIFSFLILIISLKFSKDINKYLLIFSYIFTIFIFYVIFSSQLKYGVWSDVFDFSRRLWLITNFGYEFNPNPLGMLAAICCLGFFFNKRYILLFLPLGVLILTQSRAAILFFLISIIFSLKLKITTYFYTLVFVLIVYFIFKDTAFFNRFKEDGENGRLERLALYVNDLKQNYLIGMPYSDYQKKYEIYGTLDNLFLSSVLNFGIFGIFVICYLLFLFLNNNKDQFYWQRFGVFFSMYIYGLFEAGFISNYFCWIPLALCLTSVNDKSILGNFK